MSEWCQVLNDLRVCQNAHDLATKLPSCLVQVSGIEQVDVFWKELKLTSTPEVLDTAKRSTLSRHSGRSFTLDMNTPEGPLTVYIFLESKVKFDQEKADLFGQGLQLMCDGFEWRHRYEEANQHSLEDDVTSLLNQRCLKIDLEKLVDKSESQRPFSVLFLDVDNFKQINDEHGHTTGSELLARIAEYLKLHFHPQGKIYRYGGDEFVVLLNGLKADAAVSCARSFIHQIGKNIFLIDGKTITNMGVSIGVAQYPRDAASARDILDIADAMMYESKRCGKRQVKSV